MPSTASSGLVSSPNALSARPPSSIGRTIKFGNRWDRKSMTLSHRSSRINAPDAAACNASRLLAPLVISGLTGFRAQPRRQSVAVQMRVHELQPGEAGAGMDDLRVEH